MALVLDKASCSPTRAAELAELVDVLLAPLALSRRGARRARVGVVELGPYGQVDVAAPLLDDRAAVRAAVSRLSPACCAASATVSATQLKVENICGPDATVGPCKAPAAEARPCSLADDDDAIKANPTPHPHPHPHPHPNPIP